MELWHSQKRRIASSSLGPAGGEQLLGSVEGPGLYFFVGENAGGKSTHLNLLLKLQHEKLLRSSANVNDGETTAFLELEPAKVTFHRSPSGDVRTTPTGIEDLPRIDEMPPAIELLISGGGLKGKDARSRARLKALLGYAPVDATEEHLERMLSTFDGINWDGSDPLFAALWLEFATEEGAGRKRRIEALRTKTEIGDWIRAHEKRFGSVLDDHELIIDIANGIASTGGNAATIARRRLAKVQGRLEQSLAEAAKAAGVEVGDEGEVPSDFRQALEGNTDLEVATVAATSAGAMLSELRGKRAARVMAEERREKQLAVRSDRPVVDSGEVDKAKAALEDAGQEVAAARALEAGALKAQAKALREKEDATERANDAFSAFVAYSDGLKKRAFDEDGTPRFGQDLAVEVERAGQLVSDLKAALDSDVSAVGKAWATLTAASDALAALIASETKATDALRAAEKRLTQAEAAAEAWDRLGVELEAPITGPDEADVESAEVVHQAATKTLAIAKAAAGYQAIAAEHVAALELAGRLDLLVKQFKAAAKDSWSLLGQVLTDELKLPWLQIDGLDIYLGYTEDGFLNNDPARIAEAQSLADQAAAAMDHLSSVALGRFVFEKIREVSDVSWRLIDDDERISTAELHEACLALMLHRRGQLGGIVVVPWQITAALDEDRILRFDKDIADAELVVFSERPRRKGDPRGLFLERVADRREALEGEEAAAEVEVVIEEDALELPEPVAPVLDLGEVSDDGDSEEASDDQG